MLLTAAVAVEQRQQADLAAAVYLVVAATAAQALQLIHLGAAQHRLVKMLVVLIITPAAVAVELGALHQLVAVTVAVELVLMALVLLVLLILAAVVQAVEQQQEMHPAGLVDQDLSLSDI
jgi:hypothetical protein